MDNITLHRYPVLHAACEHAERLIDAGLAIEGMQAAMEADMIADHILRVTDGGGRHRNRAIRCHRAQVVDLHGVTESLAIERAMLAFHAKLADMAPN